MAQCTKCGKKGWFLKLKSGLCHDCLKKALVAELREAVRGKVLVANPPGGMWNSKDRVAQGLADLREAFRARLKETSVTTNRAEASAIIDITARLDPIASYGLGGIGGTLSQIIVRVDIRTGKGKLVWAITRAGDRPIPAPEIHKMLNTAALRMYGTFPTADVLKTVDQLFLELGIHK